MTSHARFVVTHLKDEEVLQRLHVLVGNSHELQADLLANLVEVDARRLYRQAACAGLDPA
jgi:hypothetical protein